MNPSIMKGETPVKTSPHLAFGQEPHARTGVHGQDRKNTNGDG